MASHIDTIPPETSAPEPPPPPRARGVLTWAVVTGASVAVAALAIVTLTGVDDDSEMPATRFNPQAEQLEREAHLEGQARTYGPDGGSAPPSEPGNGAAQEAQAEKLERQAHLDGLAWTYGRHPTP
jgi:hypothetical protein